MAKERTFTLVDGVERETFRGICRDVSKAKLIGLVYYEGDPELWAMDSLACISEIKRYYRQAFGLQDIRVAVYSQIC